MAFQKQPVSYQCRCSWCKQTFNSPKKDDFLCSATCEKQWEINHVYFGLLKDDGFFERWWKFCEESGSGINLDVSWWRSRVGEDFPVNVGGKCPSQDEADRKRMIFLNFNEVFEQNKYFITKWPPFATPAEFMALPEEKRRIYKCPEGLNQNRDNIMTKQILPVNQPDMTKEEALAVHATLKHHANAMRSNLLDMRDRNGWKALGFTSFEEYGEKEWGYSRTYINRLAKAEEIQKSLSVPIGTSEIPESQLRPLSVIPEADRDAIYQQALKDAEAKGEKLTAAKVQDAVKDYQAKLKGAEMSLQVKEAKIDELEAEKKQLAETIALLSQPQKKVSTKAAEISRLEQLAAQKDQAIEQLKAQLAAQSQKKPALESDIDEALKLKIVEFYDALADNILVGATEILHSLQSFNETQVKEDYPNRLKEILPVGTRDRLAQAAEKMAVVSQSLDFLLTGKPHSI